MDDRRQAPTSENDAGQDFDHLVADAAHHVLERRDAQAAAEKPKTPRAKTPVLVLLLVILLGVVGWNVYYFSSLGRITAEVEEAYLQTTIYLTALALDAQYEETGTYPATLAELAMDEEGLTYARSSGGYTLVAQGESNRVEYRSGEDLAPFRQGFEALQSGEVGR